MRSGGGNERGEEKRTKLAEYAVVEQEEGPGRLGGGVVVTNEGVK